MDTVVNWAETDKRELDALIAVKIFGYELHVTQGMYFDPHEGIVYTEEIPYYTTDMNNAMLIIQHVDTYVSFGYSPAASRHEPHVDHYYCEITLCDWPEYCSVQAYAKTLPEAICVAALRKEGIRVTNAFEALTAWELTDEDGQKYLFKTFKQAHEEYQSREKRLRDNLQWAKSIRKLKIQETLVPEDFWNGIEMA